MNQKDKIFIGQWQKKNGKLVFKHKAEESLFYKLAEGIREGCVLTIMVDFADDNGTLSQISKLKAGTREIAHESGHSFIEIEQEIKKQAGLYDEIEKVYKSFGNCSREQLSSAIQVMINIGETFNIDLS